MLILTKKTLLLSLFILITLLSACYKGDIIEDKPFLEDFSRLVIVDNESEDYICSIYGNSFDDIIDSSCENVYTKLKAIQQIIIPTENADIDITYTQYDNILTSKIQVKQGQMSYSVTIDFNVE